MSKTMKFALALLIAALVGTINIPAFAAPPGGRIAIMNAHSDLCLSPAGGGRGKNDEIVQFTCDQDPSRFWTFHPVGDDVVKIVNVNSGLCLTVAGGNSERNTPSVQYACDNDPSRRWHYIVDGGSFRLMNVHSDLCLTIAGGGTGKNVTAVQFPCDGDPSRNWKIKPLAQRID